jgi:hypothetical protein
MKTGPHEARYLVAEADNGAPESRRSKVKAARKGALEAAVFV